MSPRFGPWLARHILHTDLPPADAQRFDAWARAAVARVTVGLSALLTASILLLWPFDRLAFREPAVVAAYDLWRPATAAIIALGAAACRFLPAAARYAYPIALGSGGAAMFLSAWMFAPIGGLEGPFVWIAHDFQFALVPVLVPIGRRVAGSLWLHGCFLAGMVIRDPGLVSHSYFGFYVLAGLLVDFANVVFGHLVYDLARRNFIQRQELRRQAAHLADANEKNERLLLNILPAPIADRLKEAPSAIADRFGEVTVLFADICEFTPLSESLPAEGLVSLLNTIFTEFDALVERHGLEKIKTIGDAYMVAGGLPEPRADHARAVADLALEMARVSGRFAAPDGRPVRLRIGVHSGPVVAGVIGRKKFSYDLWGDTVNTASRMESHGIPGEITVREATRERLGAAYAFEDRGVLPVKGKGEMRLYLLKGTAASASATPAHGR